MSANVLIVDDSLTVRMDLADAFTAAGFCALPCANLSDARKVLSNGTVDAAILDVLLPDGDGIELLGELRRESRGRVAVLVLSSEAEVHDRVRGLKTGADEYVGKPYDIGYVIARTRQLLHSRASSAPDSKLILVIDDSLTFRQELSAALEQGGYRVTSAATGEEGLRIAAQQRPLAIIVDGVLPGIDGNGVIRRVKLDAALRAVPCLLLTASSQLDEELRALDSGADAFLRKGDDATLVLAKLNAVLRSATESHQQLETKSLLSPKKILAVDDSATYREELATSLREEGYQVISAQSGEEAIELLSLESVDCVLLDLIMPGIGGEETCRRLKAAPHVRDTPIVVLTAVEERSAMLAALAQGADDYIEKSSEFEVLKARVRAQLRRRQFEDETRQVREQLLRSEMDIVEARAARELAETRAALVEELERANHDLKAAYAELQQAQSQLVQSAKMASLGQLVAGVAHEINNPLAFVISHLGTVKVSLGKLDAELENTTLPAAREHLDRAQNRVQESGFGLERIRELILKLRTFSRLDEGERKIVSIRESVESVLTIMQHRCKGIDVHTHFGEPDQLDCFPSLLNQAIMNLVANALDAIGEQGTLTLTTGADQSNGVYEIVVEDSGPGIPEQLRERVLEPFFTTKPVGQGTGLGLSISYSIVHKHGGKLELSAGAAGGARAVIRIPLHQRGAK
ncbi:MAG TPA: response regulator [Polyangiaceae bacterium]|jgi:DNA-binding response OmpR family regulator